MNTTAPKSCKDPADGFQNGALDLRALGVDRVPALILEILVL